MHELNLLPEERRISLRWRQMVLGVKRLLLTILISLLFITLVGSLVWGWAKFSINQEQSVELEEKVKTYQELRDKVAAENARLRAVVQAENNRLVWSALVGELLTALPTGIEIKVLEIDEKNKWLSFQGTAPDRAVLIVMERQVSALSWVAETVAPASNLLQRVNPQFEFKIYVKENQ
jgi:Tfp pilus assembly protein PilN